MKLKKTPYLGAARSDDTIALKPEAGRDKRRKKRWIVTVFLAVMIIAGACLLLANHTYKKAVRAAVYGHEASQSGRYAQFKEGIVRYSRDGIAFLNRRNEEQWMNPCQMSHPSIDISMGAFAVADLGGNSILVFTKDGLKGEIQTALPIEKFSVSAQGVVSALLKNEGADMIVLYDAVGNVLVEQQTGAGNSGLPLTLAISPDGETLGVSYLHVADGIQKSKIIFYNYGKSGSGKIDNIVLEEEYDEEIFPEIHFLGKDTAAAVGDKSFVIYKVGEIPEKKDEILLEKEIKSVFYTDKYIGFILLNANKSGYEARLYDKGGRKIMTFEFTGEYTDIKMAGNDIIMTAGPKCLIITKKGVLKYKGDMPADILEIIPLRGFSRYLVMGRNELNVVYLTK